MKRKSRAAITRRRKRTADYTEKPYAQWVEDIMRDMFEIDPVSIALQMRDSTGQTYTSYWQCSRDDLAIMADAIAEDKIISLLRDSRDTLLEIVNGEEGEEDDDGLCESDTETDSEG